MMKKSFIKISLIISCIGLTGLAVLADDKISIGNGAEATVNGAIAIGHHFKNDKANSLAVGFGTSKPSLEVNAASVNINTKLDVAADIKAIKINARDINLRTGSASRFHTSTLSSSRIRASSARITRLDSAALTSSQIKATSTISDKLKTVEADLGNVSADHISTGTLFVSGDLEVSGSVTTKVIAASEAGFGNVKANNLLLNSLPNDPEVKNYNSFVVGTYSHIEGGDSSILGSGSSIQGYHSVVLGDSNTVRANRSVVIGSSNLVVSSDAIAIGSGLTNVAREKSIVLGYGEAALYIGDYATTTNVSDPLLPMAEFFYKPDSRVGIGTLDPQRKLHIGDAMRLEPLNSPPENPAMGDIYMNKSGALCAYFSYEDGEGYWEKIGGHGDCATQEFIFPWPYPTNPPGLYPTNPPGLYPTNPLPIGGPVKPIVGIPIGSPILAE